MQLFQSTLPVRGATTLLCVSARYTPISIHAPREGSDGGRVPLQGGHPISIHAPREGSDPDLVDDGGFSFEISIHAPREGSDYYRYLTHQDNPEFQSTLPVRGATGRVVGRRPAGTRFQSTLPVRGATGSVGF